jgi:hypothetical protein
MPPQKGMILDYAGPRKRSQFRLASRSLLAVSATRDDGVVVREWLDGQSTAFMAIAGCGLTLPFLAVVIFQQWAQTEWWLRIFSLAIIAAGLALIPVVIQQSWRETVLRAWDGTLRLTMGGPLSRRTFAWQFDEVDAVRVIVTQNQAGASTLAEIEIIAARTPPIRLFTDHREAELSRIHAAIDRVMRGLDPAMTAQPTIATAAQALTAAVAASTEAERGETLASLQNVVERTRRTGHRT